MQARHSDTQNVYAHKNGSIDRVTVHSVITKIIDGQEKKSHPSETR